MKDIIQNFRALEKKDQLIFFLICSTISNFIVGILKNKDDAEDIVQSVFIKLHILDNSKLPENNIPSWMYTLTKLVVYVNLIRYKYQVKII